MRWQRLILCRVESLQKASPEYTLLVLSISTPLIVGIYRDSSLIETIESEQKISEVLVGIITEILERYPVRRILYTNGPGSYMSIKLTYIILKTIELVRKIPFAGCDAFEFNGGHPIRAIGKLYFVREGEKIVTRRFDEVLPQDFLLPSSIASLPTIERSVPNYSLPAV